MTLENGLEQIERSERSSTIEIRNLPKQESENKRILIDIIQQLGSTLDLETPIHQFEIRDIFRPKSEVVVVDFTTTQRKESLITKYKKYNKSRRENKEPQLKSDHFKLPGLPCTIYISEYLTNKTQRLFYLARENVKNKKFIATWTSFGKVYIKKKRKLQSVLTKNQISTNCLCDYF